MFRMTGADELLTALNVIVKTMRPSGAVERATRLSIDMARRYAASITHRQSGILASAHTSSFEVGGGDFRGRIYLDPAVKGERGTPPSIYGLAEHAKGGSHAFYERTAAEAWPSIKNMLDDVIVGSLPR